MDSVKEDFASRCQEIEEFLDYLTILSDKDKVVLSYTEDNQTQNQTISSQFLNTLTANSFLLLYNLIEAIVTNLIYEVYRNVKDSQLPYSNLSQGLQKLWLQHTIKEKKDEPTYDFVYNFSQDIIEANPFNFNRKWLPFSGNLDAKKIRDISYSFGFETVEDGRELEQIKEKRNKLAHGELTFSNVGRDFTVKEIKSYNEKVVSYLKALVNSVQKFIEDGKFKAEENNS